MVGSMIQILGRDKALQLMRELSKQELRIQSATGLSLSFFVRENFPSNVANRINQIEGVKEKGCPADSVGIQPLTQRPPVAIAIAKSAPHPSAAKVYIDFMLFRETQQVSAAC